MCNYFVHQCLLQDPLFANQLHDRYFDLRNTILSTSYLNHYIDSIQTLVDEAQVRHYTKWDILGKNVGTPEMETPPTTYAGEVTKLKTWIDVRITYLDKAIAKMYTPGISTVQNVNGSYSLRVFPNSATDFVYVEDVSAIEFIKVYNTMGQLVMDYKADGAYSIRLNVAELPSDIYMIQVKNQNNTLTTTKLLKR